MQQCLKLITIAKILASKKLTISLLTMLKTLQFSPHIKKLLGSISIAYSLSNIYCRGTLRKLFALHVYTVRKPNFDRFHEEQYKVRRDFDKILKSKDEKEIQIMLEKFEMFIERFFEPYAAMHECRPHSNLWGKLLVYN